MPRSHHQRLPAAHSANSQRKSESNVEFGAKTGTSICEGYTLIDHLSWNAYNEEADAGLQIKLFKGRFDTSAWSFLCCG